MELASQALDSGQPFDRPLQYYRTLTAVCGIAYLIWWVFVEVLLPGAFNPLGSRLGVVFFCWLIWGASFFSRKVEAKLASWFSVCLWVLTAHYFYLFYRNEADINWVVGSYIAVIAAAALLQSELALRAYSGWVLLLSAVLCWEDQVLLKTIFLPGIVTVLLFANLGLRSRLRLLEQGRETSFWFQGLFDSVFEGVVVHEEGVIRSANASFAKIFGYDLKELIGRKVSDCVLPEDREITARQIREMTEAPYEVRGLRKNGSVAPIEVRATMRVLGGRTLRLAAVADLTARKKNERDRVLYESSQKALKMRDEFLSIASHELKTPLTNLKLQTQIAMRELKKAQPALSPERVRRFIEQTDRQADRLIHLVDEMLDVSKISSGRMGVRLEEVDLVALVKEVAAAFDGMLTTQGYRLELVTPESAKIRADRFRMEQVISNLISNAIKYGDQKPIQISVVQRGGETQLMVADQGTGISKENHQRIFERFERGISADKISGLGLGLYISKYIVDAHGGRIEVASQPAQGSRFTVVLPQRAAEGQG